VSLRLDFAVRSDVGHVREGNEDSAYAGVRLLAVADGMGGHAAGEVASSTVISRLAVLDEAADTGDVLDALAGAMHDANAQLRSMSIQDGSLEGMGTTVTALLASGDRLGVLHVGDSRAYLLRDEVLSQVTHDHTLVQDLVDQGRITPEQANTHPQRSLLMRALDGREVEPDLSVRQAVPGDRYLLCTDGLSSVVSEETILEALLLPTPQDAVDRLVELALKGGGPDNVTVVVADVLEDGEPEGYPLVAGAAAEKRIVPGASPARTGPDPQGPDNDSAAAKAARIGRGFHRRDRDPEPPADEPSERGRHQGGRRILFVTATVIILLVLGAAAGWAWIRSQYYVGVDDGRVAVFQGVKEIGGVSLSTVRSHDRPINEVPEPLRSRIMNGIEVGSFADAQRIIDQLPPAPTPPLPTTTPSATPTPTPTGQTKAANVPGIVGALPTPCPGRSPDVRSAISCLAATPTR
jgi:PPM family protein phosphatase